ncbi:peptide ABC transporter substrate-binding protein [Actinobacillus pleuropneumoniae]|uniref:peptide ABC transporter substrate-binding protein n=1 Tax=Actinobacillus pleuropneumoniae TaxID=715 RepID=UPI001F417B47|nr:peptide ABC transporter substrate-binding protein [Actinobacillus pleuropneumoniae]UKH16515.1 peptide ABC transporter substrate-binding protein [Actinobacillus pleuropneumoniae]
MHSAKQAVKFFQNLVGLLACLLILSACERDLPVKHVEPAKPETLPIIDHNILKRAIYTNKFQLDPHFVYSSAESAPLRDLFSGLLAYNEKGIAQPALAKTWFTENNKDWLFILDENAKWSNGKAVTAQDIVLSWQRLANPKNASPLAPYLVYMQLKHAKEILNGEKAVGELGVKALNATTLQIRLEKPNLVLPKMLAHVALLPSYQGEIPNPNMLITNGDYALAAQTDKSLLLQAVKNDPSFAKVEYHRISVLQSIKPFDVVENPLEGQQHNIWEFPRLCNYYYEFNFADPQLKHKEIRQAIKTMILSARIPHQYGIANFSVLPKSMLNSIEHQWNPIIIETLLTQAGINSNNPLQITLSYDEQGKHTEIAQQMIRTLGQSDLIKVTPQALDWSQLLAVREQKNYQLSRAGWCAEYADPLPFLLHFHSKSVDNKSNYHNPQVDEKLERLQNQNLTEEVRTQLIQSVVKHLDDDVAVLPMFQYYRRVALDPTILGIDLNNDSEVIYSKHLYRLKPKD